MTNDERNPKPEARKKSAVAAFFFVILISSFVISAVAQDDFQPAKKTGVQLQFIPPPMEGTVSLGIYDAAGKLVRVLHAEAQPAEFTAALNGLITFWDGKDDAGKLMSAGKYSARGYLVGAMDFEGVAFLGNDWIVDEKSPRIRRVDSIHAFKDNSDAVLSVELADSKMIDVKCDANGKIEQPGMADFPKDITEGIVGELAANNYQSRLYPSKTVTVRDGKIVLSDMLSNPAEHILDLPAFSSPVDACLGQKDSIWVIDHVPDGTTEVKQYAMNGEFLRRLVINASDPQPAKIAASQTADAILLLEQNGKLQRVCGLLLVQQNLITTATPTSTWKIDFQKTIAFSDTLDAVRDLLKFPGGKPFVPQEKIALRLLPNPLEQDKPGAVEISIGTDAKGSFLKAGDGLPLCRVSETPSLRWAAMAREPDSKAITIFQSDGAVVEQFKASKLANMMAFDCGDFDFDPAKMK